MPLRRGGDLAHYLYAQDGEEHRVHLNQNFVLKYSLMADYYQYILQRILQNDRVKLPWYNIVTTDHSVDHNRPNLVLFRKEELSTFIIDVVVSLGRNTVEAQKRIP